MLLNQARNKGKQLFFVLGGVLSAVSLAFMASRLDFWPSGTPAASATPPSVTVAGNPPEPRAKPVPAAPESKPKPAGEPTKGAPVPLSDQSAGNLAVLTSLRAELEETKLRTAIAQEKEKQISKAPVAVLAPPPAVQGTPPPARTPEKSRETAPVVVSVQGVDGSTTATIRARGKLTTVKVGENFGGGIVSSITRDGVAVKTGKSVITYRFE